MTVPDGMSGGQEMTITLDGRGIHVDIPAGLDPGDEFDVELDPEEEEEKAAVMKDRWDAKEGTQLTAEIGQLVFIVDHEKNSEHWTMCRLADGDELSGWLPASYLEEI